MHLHRPHIKPQQRALLRSLLGAVVAILAALVLIGLMVILLVFPDKAFGFQVVVSPENEVTVSSPMLQR